MRRFPSVAFATGSRTVAIQASASKGPGCSGIAIRVARIRLGQEGLAVPPGSRTDPHHFPPRRPTPDGPEESVDQPRPLGVISRVEGAWARRLGDDSPVYPVRR